MRIVDSKFLAQIPERPTYFGAATGSITHFTRPRLTKAAHLNLVAATDNAQHQIEFDLPDETT